MCQAVEMSRIGYYAFETSTKSQNRINNDNLLIEINRVFWDNVVIESFSHTLKVGLVHRKKFRTIIRRKNKNLRRR